MDPAAFDTPLPATDPDAIAAAEAAAALAAEEAAAAAEKAKAPPPADGSAAPAAGEQPSVVEQATEMVPVGVVAELREQLRQQEATLNQLKGLSIATLVRGAGTAQPQAPVETDAQRIERELEEADDKLNSGEMEFKEHAKLVRKLNRDLWSLENAPRGQAAPAEDIVLAERTAEIAAAAAWINNVPETIIERLMPLAEMEAEMELGRPLDDGTVSTLALRRAVVSVARKQGLDTTFAKAPAGSAPKATGAAPLARDGQPGAAPKVAAIAQPPLPTGAHNPAAPDPFAGKDLSDLSEKDLEGMTDEQLRQLSGDHTVSLKNG
jgi:hypothetical protein